MIGVALTVALFAFFWVLRGKLNTWGLEYVQWSRTSPLSIVRAVVLGVLAGSAIAWLFRNYEMGVQPPFAEMWIAVTWDRVKLHWPVSTARLHTASSTMCVGSRRDARRSSPLYKRCLHC